MAMSRVVRSWLSAMGTVIVPLVISMSGVTGFWPEFGICAAAILWSIWLFRHELGRLVLKPPNTQSQNYERAWWLLFPGFAALLIAIFPFVHLYSTLRYQPQPLGFEDLLQTYMHDRSIYISDLARTETIVHDKVFERVTFVGPAMIVFLGGNTSTGAIWHTDGGGFGAVFLEVPNKTETVGAIGFRNCIFKDCNFIRIQVMAPKSQIDQVKNTIAGINGK